MKNLNLISIIFLAFACKIIAQAPQKFSYQAVIRNSSDQLVKDQDVGLRMSIVSGSENGNIVYQEIFNPNPRTNINGLLTLQIGGGIAITGSFNNINWSAGSYFVRTEADPTGGTNYTLNTTSQLLSIPYALLAKNVENIPSISLNQLSDVNTQPALVGQVLKWNGTEWIAANDDTEGSNGITYTAGSGISIDVNNVITNTGDLSNTNEIQQLTISGTVLTLSQNGGSVTLPSTGTGGDNWGSQSVVNDASTISGIGTPSSPIKLASQNATNGQVLKSNGSTWVPGVDNDNQNLSISGNQLNISNGNAVILPADGDGSPTNEIQQLELSGNQLKLTSANTVTLPTGTTYTAGTGISLANNIITNIGDNDNNASNELQNLTLSGTVLTLSQGGGSVTLPTSGGGDNWGTQSAVTDFTTLTGNGTPSSPLKIANQNATNGQVLKSNGTTWVPGADNDNQSLSVSGNQINISNGNSVTIPADGDGSSTNEIQTLSLSGANVNLSNGGGSITLPDASSTNEIQALSIAGQNLTLSNGGGTVTLPSSAGPWTVTANDIYNNNVGNVSIGENFGFPDRRLNVNGGTQFGIFATTSSFNGVIRANQTHANGDALQGIVISGTGRGVWGESNNGVGVYGAGEKGVVGSSFSNGTGVFGTSTGSGTAIHGQNFDPNGFAGLFQGNVFASAIECGDLIPKLNNSHDIGSPSFKWDKFYSTSIVGAKSEGSWLPTANGSMNLGSSSAVWNTLYAFNIVGARSDGEWLPTETNSMNLGRTDKIWNKLYTNTIVGAKNEGDWLPSTNGTVDLGSTAAKWDKLYTNTIVEAKHEGDWLPSTNGTVDLGSTTSEWDKLYTNTIVGAKHEGDWLPSTNGTVDLGSTTAEWDKLFVNTIVNTKSDGDFTPLTNIGSSLGSTSLKWDKLYLNQVEGALRVNGNCLPDVDDNYNLGGVLNRWDNIYATNATIQSSDRRLKKNIESTSYGLKSLMKLRPVSWEWKNSSKSGKYLGFIAQDLLEIVPEAVVVPTLNDYEEYKVAKGKGKSVEEPSLGIRYTELIPVLTKAIQEQQVMIDDQNKKIEALIKRIEALEKN
jgi:hypothetical protein